MGWDWSAGLFYGVTEETSKKIVTQGRPASGDVTQGDPADEDWDEEDDDEDGAWEDLVNTVEANWNEKDFPFTVAHCGVEGSIHCIAIRDAYYGANLDKGPEALGCRLSIKREWREAFKKLGEQHGWRFRPQWHLECSMT